MAGNVAQIRSRSAEAQAFINLLCRHAVGREFAIPDSRSSAAVVESARWRVAHALADNGIGGLVAGIEQSPSGQTSSPIVIWKSSGSVVYFAPTGSDVKSEFLGSARKGTVHELITFNAQVRPSVEPQLDHDLIAVTGYLEFLAAYCHGGAFSPADNTSTITVLKVDGENGHPEPVVIWVEGSGDQARKVAFLPQDSTVSPSTIAMMNAQPGTQVELLEFKERAASWLGPRLEDLAGQQQSLYERGLGD